MKVLCIGSLNLDMVYQMDHIVQPGETEASYGMNIFLGGKGINQSMAVAKAGANVYHAGLIGEDGQAFLDACREYGVDSRYIRKVDARAVMPSSRSTGMPRTAFCFTAVPTRC